MLFCMTPKHIYLIHDKRARFRAMLFCMTPKQLALVYGNYECFRAMLFCETLVFSDLEYMH